MLQQRRLNLDFSPLWENPEERYIVRYLDTNEIAQKTLALRIKESSPIYTVRRKATWEEIQETLKQINPIIFSESMSDYYGRSHHTRFAKFSVNELSGYRYKRLCRAIYYINCLKRPLQTREIEEMADLTIGNWTRATRFVEDHFRTVYSPQNQERLCSDPVGIEEIERARRSAEDNGATRDPQPRIEPYQVQTRYYQAVDPSTFATTMTQVNIQAQPYPGFSPVFDPMVDEDDHDEDNDNSDDENN